MLETDARRIAAEIEQRFGAGAPGTTTPGVTVKVASDRTLPNVIPAGAGRPAFIRYHIQIDDGTRVAVLDLDQAAALLDDVEPGCGPDRLFDAIRSRGGRVEDAD